MRGLQYRLKHLSNLKTRFGEICAGGSLLAFLFGALFDLVVSRAGDAARAWIEEVEQTTRLLAEVWDQ